MPKIVTVVGNRPQFVKLANTARRLRELGADAPFESIVVNTGQHYDAMLSDVFFAELKIEPPDYDLGIGSGPIVDQIARMMPRLREIFEQERPDAVLVYGDTNSTVAAALTAAHLDIPVIHVEGGERLYRRADMPEEINRVATDHLADLCLCSSRKAERFLRREGFGPERALFVGDPMYDIFRSAGPVIDAKATARPATFGLEPGGFVLATIHRAENTAERETAVSLLEALDSAPVPVLLPAHPRLTARLADWGWRPAGSLRLADPLGYFDFQLLLRECALVVSDSGGVGREAFFAGKPCIVPLESSAWTEAVESGLSINVGHDAGRLAHALHHFRPAGDFSARIEHEFGRGDAADRIIAEVARYATAARRGGEGAWHPLGPFDALPGAIDCSGFSHASFAAMLDRLKGAGYRFADYGERGKQPGPICLLRHDVTVDLRSACALASIEAEAGVSATFFLTVSGDGYNPFAPEETRLVREMLGLGHRIGVLCVPGCPPERAAAEAGLLERWFSTTVDAVAGCDLPGGADSAELAGFVRIDEFGDDRKAGDMTAHPAFAERRDLQLVVRPLLWAEMPVSPLESELRALDRIRDRRLGAIAGGLLR